jgi:hypothetical protein
MIRDGAFEFRHVSPGRYDLLVRRQGPGGEGAWALQEINVAGTSIDGLVLTLEPASHCRAWSKET